MEKNVNVVDENGNQYEATWPRRARGLVKCGRARFVDDNTICLTCPPNINLEDNKMDNSITNITADAELTEREVFDQIVALQKELTTNLANCMASYSEVMSSIFDEKELDDAEEMKEIVEAAVVPFESRETVYQTMLEIYRDMYRDAHNRARERAEIVRASFDHVSAYINESDMTTDDKFAALGHVTDKIAELVGEIIK